jgi:hypothetical protein
VPRLCSPAGTRRLRSAAEAVTTETAAAAVETVELELELDSLASVPRHKDSHRRGLADTLLVLVRALTDHTPTVD